MCTLCTLRRTGPATYTASVVHSLAQTQGCNKLVMLPLDDNCLDTLMENTFDPVGEIFDSDFNDIQMEEESDDQNLVQIDSRLDLESVLLDDIKFDLDAMDSRLTDYAHNPEMNNSVSSSDRKEMAVNGVIKLESKENLETLLSPQQRDRCNTWPRQLQAMR